MIPYGHQSVDKKDIAGVVKTLKSDYLTQGPRILEFEKALANYCGAKYAVVCSSGTAALHLAYLAAGLGRGDEIITTPNTFVATTNMMLAVGAKPVFCDIRLDTYNINEKKIERLITKKTRAIVPVHFAGQSCEMSTIYKIAQKYKLLVIEDACHALGAKYQHSTIGDCRYSDLAVFSFHPVKSITTGEGGAILTNNKEYYEKLKLLRSHGVYKDKNGKNVMIELGFNYRATEMQTALGASQLKKLDNFIAKRQKVVGWHNKALNEIKEIILPQSVDHCFNSWHLYVVRTKNPKHRDQLSAYLKQKGIGVNFHYPAIYSHPFYRKNGYKKVKLKNMDEYHNSTITLPCYVNLTKKDIRQIAVAIKNYYRINQSIL
jgi:UDP-4-amino-4,6-dideoxy-N-acetyl-beta-L-altrosamine transaminase